MPGVLTYRTDRQTDRRPFPGAAEKASSGPRWQSRGGWALRPTPADLPCAHATDMSVGAGSVAQTWGSGAALSQGSPRSI